MSIVQVIENLVARCDWKRLTSTDDEPIFTDPLVGFADGEDPLFSEYKRIIGDFHFTPREILEKHFPEWDGQKDSCSVICWVLPISEQIRKSNAAQSTYPSEKWAHAKFYGERFNNHIRRTVANNLLQEGYLAVAPALSPHFTTRYEPEIASSWSERHALYAAGLGTFGLSDGFITPKGIAMRCGSVVTNLKMKLTVRRYENHLENCLFHASGKCGICIKRCPVGAIDKNGHNKRKCREHCNGACADHVLRNYGIETNCCGLCQTGVPCESKIPRRL